MDELTCATSRNIAKREKTKNPGSKSDPEAVREAVMLLQGGDRPSVVLEKLTAKNARRPASERLPLPSLRSLQALAAAVGRPEQWSIGDGAADDAAVVLRVFRENLRQFRGMVAIPSAEAAAWTARLAAVAPTMPVQLLRQVAAVYQWRAGHDEGTGDLDSFVACEPWSPDGRRLYVTVLQGGWLPAPPMIVLNHIGFPRDAFGFEKFAGFPLHLLAAIPASIASSMAGAEEKQDAAPPATELEGVSQ